MPTPTPLSEYELVENSIENWGYRLVKEDDIIFVDPKEFDAMITDGDQTLNATAIVGVDLNQKGMQMPQKFGAASSYGKKYALGNLFLIDDTADSDAINTHGITMTNKEVTKAKEFVKAGGKIEAIKKKYQITPDLEKELKTL